jgi:hypothetical protein
MVKRRETAMKSRISGARIAIIALATVASVTPAFAQSGQAGLYAFHSGPVVGGCPGLDWHITLGPDNSLTGFVAWDQGKHMARLTGSINKDRSFTLDAQEVGGTGRKAIVKGSAGGNYINAVINGSGTPCDGDNLAIPRVAGGLAGGGG